MSPSSHIDVRTSKSGMFKGVHRRWALTHRVNYGWGVRVSRIGCAFSSDTAQPQASVNRMLAKR